MEGGERGERATRDRGRRRRANRRADLNSLLQGGYEVASYCNGGHKSVGAPAEHQRGDSPINCARGLAGDSDQPIYTGSRRPATASLRPARRAMRHCDATI